ncbi:hypothetical protein GCM10009869_07070 [Amnibacterium kyonggiense]
MLALVALGFALIPVFQANILAPGDTYYFTNWDRHSQALVLSKIEQDTTGEGSSRFGLVAANPDPDAPYSTFDGLRGGAVPASTSYSPYASSLGLQGWAFEGLYRAGCSTLNCLNTVESGVFSLVLVLFTTLLALAVRRSFGIVVLLSSLVSPWVVSSAHNLYWVPWTWLLPACAAAGVVLARTRRQRIVWIVMAGAATALKSTTGYEYLSTTTLLAASIPVLAMLLGRPVDRRTAFRRSAAVFASCVAGFLVVLIVHILVTGQGSFVAGADFVVHDALRRTHGSAALDSDPLVNASLKASLGAVLTRYIVGWSTALFAVGIGGPYPSLSIGTGGFWGLSVLAVGAVVLQLVREPVRGRRDLAVLVAGVAPALSWFVLAKSHSFTETNENYVLWYLICIPTLVWLLGSAVLRWLRPPEAEPERLGAAASR